ncbi:MAG: hypothetical protein INR73_04420 [Williamsia sp.]|nr:hypothetical protein [Williamsia sp.]
MRKIILQHEIAVLLGCFVLSRLLVAGSGVLFQYEPLFTYWQYLDINCLRHEALKSVWYMHGQPPLFNLVVAAVLKGSGPYDRPVFQLIWMGISLCNALLILRLLKSRLGGGWLPLAAALWYALGPATILFENELFYTSFASLLLLLALFYLNRFEQRGHVTQLPGFFFFLVLLCLTRATFHLLWLIGVCGALGVVYNRKRLFKWVVGLGLASLLLAGSWYLKNAILFGTFSVSSWTGINFSRIVFHDVSIRDSSSIAAIHPFYPVSYYKRYISPDFQQQYEGKDDPVLLHEMKNDSAINMNHVGYVQVSRAYMKAGFGYISHHPAGYLKNTATSFVIFFTPASSYFQVAENCRKLSWYDALYSFNLSHFFSTKPQQKAALVVSALPKLLVYCLVFWLLVKRSISQRRIGTTEAFIAWTILYILVTSTLFEYGENMRFRYEVEPLFLILGAGLIGRRKSLR